MISFAFNMYFLDSIVNSMGVTPRGAGVIILFYPTAIIAFVLTGFYTMIFDDKTDLERLEIKVKEMEIKKKRKDKNKVKVIPIEGSTYILGDNVIAKTRDSNAALTIWKHVNNFSDKVKAEKFSEMVTSKGLIDTKYWIIRNGKRD